MTRPAQRTAQRAARWPRLLLLAVLLLGIVTMHTLGHPSRSHAMEDATAVAAVASAVRAAGHTSGHIAADQDPDHTADHGTGGTPRREAPGDRAPAAGAPLPGTGMDPMSVCLAVLGGLTLLILGAGPAGLRDAAPLGGAARTPGRSGGPDPPSPRERLTRLAVLRV
ncbi:hypothetical protein OG311_12240 [Streptomyces sp. NBC_01343]|uniref:hypothetical protein n=1 Tax=Streptomyces sp. NBC_01343 TaxID=2903832 RepID=UPI002E155AC4|nr:hypothetical protein OG311_12240 [Streptomyces sp. NBC_01343]